MARRLLVCSSRIALGLLLLAGCRGNQSPVPVAGESAVAGKSAGSPAPAAPLRKEAAQAPLPVAKPPLEILPGSSTITADDPGLQLLAAQKRADRCAT